MSLVARPRREVPQPPPLAWPGPARVVAIRNQKGGVGKTTSTINLGAALTEYDPRAPHAREVIAR